MNYQVVSICTNCGKLKQCGKDCSHCVNTQVSSVNIAKYAGAMKDAVQCWANAACEEHNIPCQPTLKEFAEKIFVLQRRIEVLESGINAHKAIKQNSDEHDEQLWKLI